MCPALMRDLIHCHRVRCLSVFNGALCRRVDMRFFHTILSLCREHQPFPSNTLFSYQTQQEVRLSDGLLLRQSRKKACGCSPSIFLAETSMQDQARNPRGITSVTVSEKGTSLTGQVRISVKMVYSGTHWNGRTVALSCDIWELNFGRLGRPWICDVGTCLDPVVEDNSIFDYLKKYVRGLSCGSTKIFSIVTTNPANSNLYSNPSLSLYLLLCTRFQLLWWVKPNRPLRVVASLTFSRVSQQN